MDKRILIIGGGIAGLQSAASLRRQGFEPVVIERGDKVGGHVAGWDRLFPNGNFAEEVLCQLREQVAGVETVTGEEITSISSENGEVRATTKGGGEYRGRAAVVATGFDLFDARLKEEYGYGLYDNVITSADLEAMFRAGAGIKTKDGRTPQKVAILHCVGSRDEKVGQNHCSKVCCITGVKQAIELTEAVPGIEVTNFYMDLRMFGNGYEELYRRAQMEHGVTFIRGRISEAGQTREKRVQLKVEDTLVGRPLRLTVDMLVLLVGMAAPKSYASLGLVQQENGFFAPKNVFTATTVGQLPGVYFAGAATGPKTIGESITEGMAVAGQITADLTAK